MYTFLPLCNQRSYRPSWFFAKFLRSIFLVFPYPLSRCSTHRPSGNNEIAAGLAIKTFWFKCFPLRMPGHPEGRPKGGGKVREGGRSKGIISLNRLIIRMAYQNRGFSMNRHGRALKSRRSILNTPSSNLNSIRYMRKRYKTYRRHVWNVLYNYIIFLVVIDSLLYVFNYNYSLDQGKGIANTSK